MDEEEKKKSSCGCCFLKILGVVMLLLLIVGGITGYFAWHAAKWVESAQETTPAVYPALIASPGEQEDIDRLIQRITAAKTDKSVIDETITPAVFNGIVNKIIVDQKSQGRDPEFLAFRAGIDGEHFTVAATKKIDAPDGSKKYANVQLVFDCEIEDGHINKLSTEKIVAGGKEAPAAVRSMMMLMLEGFKKSINDGSSPEAKKFRGFKLLKRDGDRIHVILDPAKFEENVNPPVTPTPATPGVEAEPKKESF